MQMPVLSGTEATAAIRRLQTDACTCSHKNGTIHARVHIRARTRTRTLTDTDTKSAGENGLVVCSGFGNCPESAVAGEPTGVRAYASEGACTDEDVRADDEGELQQDVDARGETEKEADVSRVCNCRKVPVIFLSAQAASGAADEATRVGADAYLVKPVRRQELLAKMQEVLSAP